MFALNRDDSEAASMITNASRKLRGRPRTEAEEAARDFHDTVWKITAALILMRPANDEKLIFHLTRAPLRLFTLSAMRAVVECWNWLLSARPDVEMKFLQEMVFAWHSSQVIIANERIQGKNWD